MRRRKRRPGVLAVLTGEDYVADGHVGMAHHPNPADANDVRGSDLRVHAGCRILDLRQLPLAVARVRHVGEAVAVVVAETLPAARDAAEAVAVEYGVLPAVTDVLEALADGAPALWPEAPGNLALDNAFGDRAAVEAALAARAPRGRSRPSAASARVSAFMEPRAAIGSYDAAEQQYTLISGCQGAHRLRNAARRLPARCRRSACA